MSGSHILILLDASHAWGLMAWRAMRYLGVPCRFAKAKEIAQGACLGKPGRAGSPAALLVPGGSARRKAEALGRAGKAAIRRWARQGGLYIGFCGGAGLALSDGKASLGLCPLPRARFERRFHHFLSGHALAQLADGSKAMLPVWWPGRFGPAEGADVEVLARYEAPGADLWLADIPLARLPRELLARWAPSRGLDPSLGFPAGEPIILACAAGKGACLLSYAHLETPNSPHANALLARLLRERAGLDPFSARIPPWGCAEPLPPGPAAPGSFQALVREAHESLRALLAEAAELGLVFKRKDWLLGWKSGFSGMACNDLLASLAFLAEFPPRKPPEELRDAFEAFFSLFLKAASDWLWAWRLDGALRPGAAPDPALAKRRQAVFGHPMLGGGLAERLLGLLERLIWAAQEDCGETL